MKLVEFSSLGFYNLDGKKIITVINNKDRKISGKNKKDFKDLFPKVVIDDIVYKIKDIESFSISFVGEGQPIGLVVD
jgi:hypothetical protein